MKCTLHIDKTREEEVIIYAHEKSKLTDAIEQLAAEDAFELVGYTDREAVMLSLGEIHCFLVESNRVYALQGKEKLQLKCRLYQLEERLPQSFVKINQSCIANIKNIERFDVSITGSLMVKFKNGYIDSVSRRNVKSIKERLGI